MNTVIYINKAKVVHKNKFDYSCANYIDSYTKIKIICPIHGEFEQLPYKHLNTKYGCRQCSVSGISKTKTSNIEGFIKKSGKIHGNEYDYSISEYNGVFNLLKIICKNHGIFELTPAQHFSGQGCKHCVIDDKRALYLNKFINKANIIHNNLYDYSITKYIDYETSIDIICKKHGKFTQMPRNHIAGNGCFDCFGSPKSNTKEFIEKASVIHNDWYDYSKLIYVAARFKVIIICPEHGEFPQSPNKHLNGQGCYLCYFKNEGVVGEYLEKFNLLNNKQHNFHFNDRKYRVDFYLKDNNSIIEYNGNQHYFPVRFGNISDEQAIINFDIQVKRDNELRNYCIENNINLIEIDGRKYKGKSLRRYLESDLVNLLRIK